MNLEFPGCQNLLDTYIVLVPTAHAGHITDPLCDNFPIFRFAVIAHYFPVLWDFPIPVFLNFGSQKYWQ